MNKKIVLVLISFGLYLFSKGQSENWIWVNSGGGSGDDEANGMALDNNGNILVAGYFTSPTFSIGNATLTNTGGKDIFIIKSDSSGNILWARTAISSGNDVVNDISSDPDGNVYIAGWFKSPFLIIGSDSLKSTDSTHADAFVIKFDSLGNVKWMKVAGDTNDDVATAICAGPSGKLDVTGFYKSFTIPLGNFFLTNQGGKDIFISKWDPMGNVIWAKGIGDTQDDEALDISTDQSENVYITGDYKSFTLPIGNSNLTNAGGADIVTAKFDSSGNPLWGKGEGGSGNDLGNIINSLSTQTIEIGGSFDSPTITSDVIVLVNVQAKDIHFQGLDASSGTVAYGYGYGGSFDESVTGITSGPDKSTLLTGFFTSPTLPLGKDTLQNSHPGLEEMFIVEYDSLKTISWNIKVGTSDSSLTGKNIVADKDIIYVTGTSSGDATIGITPLLNKGSKDFFIGKVGKTNPSGLQKNFEIFALETYPNPANEYLFISVKKNFGGMVSVSLSDVLGQRVYFSEDLSEKGTFQKQVDINKISKGIYFIEVVAGQKKYSGKIIK